MDKIDRFTLFWIIYPSCLLFLLGLWYWLRRINDAEDRRRKEK